jgi:hypothetical protein
MVSFQQTSANKKTYVADAIVLLTEKKKKKLLPFCKLLTSIVLKPGSVQWVDPESSPTYKHI